MVEVRLLGKFEILRDGQVLPALPRPSQALLAYLVLNPDVLHPRDKLAGILWPDSGEPSARSNLRQALWRVQRILGKDTLRSDRTSLALFRSDSFSADAYQLEQPADALETSQLLRAASSYSGELLPGHYDNWITFERERLAAAFERVCSALLDRLIDEGRWSEVPQWAENWISFGTGPEQAYRVLMTAYARLGESGKVRSTFERCAAVLREQLDVEPSTETRDLFEHLLDSLSGTTSPGEAAMPGRQGQPSEYAIHVRPPAPSAFVGREEPLGHLQRLLDLAHAGSGGVVFVLGDAGQGKTGLLRELSRRSLARHPKLAVAFGTCDAYSGVGDPYLPFRQIAGNLTGEVDPLVSGGFMEEHRALELLQSAPMFLEVLDRRASEIVSLVLPDLGLISNAAPDVRRSLTRRTERRRVLPFDQAIAFEQFSRFLRAVADVRPLLLLVDDLQWADDASLGLLLHLGRSVAQSRILLVAAYRPADVVAGRGGRRHPLEGVVNELRRIHGEILIDLELAEESEGREFVRAFLSTEPHRLGQDFQEALFHHTRGQALFTI